MCYGLLVVHRPSDRKHHSRSAKHLACLITVTSSSLTLSGCQPLPPVLPAALHLAWSCGAGVEPHQGLQVHWVPVHGWISPCQLLTTPQDLGNQKSMVIALDSRKMGYYFICTQRPGLQQAWNWVLMLEVIVWIGNCTSFLQKMRIDGFTLAVYSHGCFLAALFLIHLFQATQGELDWIQGRELLVESLLLRLLQLSVSFWFLVLRCCQVWVGVERLEVYNLYCLQAVEFAPADTTVVQKQSFPCFVEWHFFLPSQF